MGSANVQIVFYDGDAPSLDAVEVEDMLLGAARTEETKKKDPTQHRCPFSTKLILVLFATNRSVGYFILFGFKVSFQMLCFWGMSGMTNLFTLRCSCTSCHVCFAALNSEPRLTVLY